MDGQISTQLVGPSGPIYAPPAWPVIARSAIGQQRCQYNEGELATLLALMHSISPTTVLEIGTQLGGSAWAFSHIPSVKRIVTVDPALEGEAIERTQRLACPVHLITGDPQQEDTIQHVGVSLGADPADVIVINGGRTYQEVASSFGHYGACGRPGGLIVLHGTQGHPDGNPGQIPKLWAELAVVYRATEIVDVPGGPGGTGVIWL